MMSMGENSAKNMITYAFTLIKFDLALITLDERPDDAMNDAINLN